MNMQLIDWLIVAGTFGFVAIVAQWVKRYTRGVADFLAANRTAGRYLLSVSDGAATLAAVNVLAAFQMYYKAGFVPIWWMMMTLPAGLIGSISGWLVYRFRETRAMTLAQFFEIRYSKKLRIFAGALCFIGGIINFGIFPAVGARFFMYFCGLPTHFSFLGFEMSTFVVTMIILLSSSLYFTAIGGQIAVIITDFIQGTFCNIAFVAIIIFLMFHFDWSQIVESLITAPEGQSMVHPMKTGNVKDFNVWFFVIQTLGYFYWRLSWQGNQAYNCSASSPHDSKMSKMLASWRYMATYFVLFLIPICAYTVMHHADFTDLAGTINGTLDTISKDSENQTRFQMLVPVVLSKILPMGLMGIFCAAMVAALISTYDSFMHSWGSIFVQDIILPLRKKPFTPKQHIWLLRLGVFFVAAFAFCWGLLFDQKQDILMYQAVTGAIFIAGSGAIIIGGLYWKKGSTAGAWSALIVGAVMAISFFTAEHKWENFPINGQYALGISIACSIVAYVVVSLLGNTNFNINKMLHRGQYSIDKEKLHLPATGWKTLAITKEFSRSDKVVYIATLAWTIGWWLGFVIFTIYNLIDAAEDGSWIKFWHYKVWISFGMAVMTFIWFFVFGLRDLKNMIKDLRAAKRDARDDGMVVDHKNLDEVEVDA